MNASGEPPLEPALEFDPIIVLLVEDEVLIRMDLAEALREAGHTVYEAGTADAAIELLQSPMRVDVVVTDIRMPGNTNGLGLAAYIHENRPSIKVVVMSGDYRPQEEDRLLFARFFSKPFDVRAVVKAVETVRNGTSLGEGRFPLYG
jgi:two-component system, response regulator PdtaR